MKHEEVKEFTKNLEEQTYYFVEVQVQRTNVPHTVILYNGFNTGAYTCVWGGTYQYPLNIENLFSIKLLSKIPYPPTL